MADSYEFTPRTASILDAISVVNDIMQQPIPDSLPDSFDLPDSMFSFVSIQPSPNVNNNANGEGEKEKEVEQTSKE